MSHHRAPGVYVEWRDPRRHQPSAHRHRRLRRHRRARAAAPAGPGGELEGVHQHLRRAHPAGYLAYAVEAFFANGGRPPGWCAWPIRTRRARRDWTSRTTPGPRCGSPPPGRAPEHRRRCRARGPGRTGDRIRRTRRRPVRPHAAGPDGISEQWRDLGTHGPRQRARRPQRRRRPGPGSSARTAGRSRREPHRRRRAQWRSPVGRRALATWPPSTSHGASPRSSTSTSRDRGRSGSQEVPRRRSAPRRRLPAATSWRPPNRVAVRHRADRVPAAAGCEAGQTELIAHCERTATGSPSSTRRAGVRPTDRDRLARRARCPARTPPPTSRGCWRPTRCGWPAAAAGAAQRPRRRHLRARRPAVGVHKPPANEPLERLPTSASGRRHHARRPQRGVLNVIRLYAGRGIRVAGARTLSCRPPWRYVNVRRLVTMIEEAIERGHGVGGVRAERRRPVARDRPGGARLPRRLWRAACSTAPPPTRPTTCGATRRPTRRTRSSSGGSRA